MSRILSPQPPPRLRWPLLYTGVAMTTLATLVLELALTRIFSVVFYYHFAFLAISIALFGLGAGGVFSYLVGGGRGPVFARIGVLSLVGAVAVLANLGFILTRGAEMTNLTLALVYLMSALPFLFAGSVVSLAIAETIERVHRVYFFDLAGAASGCLLLIPLLNAFGGPNTVIAAAVLYAASAAVWFTLGGAPRGRITAVALGLGLVALVAFNVRGDLIDVRYAKGRELGRESFVKWNSFSRIAIAPETGNPGTKLIIIDADASTGIANFDFDRLTPEDRAGLMRGGPGFVYGLRPGAKTLVIGAGGGYDVARALAAGSRDVSGVEINPIIANTIMRERFPGLSRGIYFRPEVRIFVEDGRSFVRRSKERYQVIQATLVDTWASTAAGAFALSENNLYTVEAFVDYLSRLSPDGLLSFTRWGFDPPRESLRLVSLAAAALARLGQPDASRSVVVYRENTALVKQWGATDTVLISRQPLEESDVARARMLAKAAGAEIVYAPGDPPREPFGRFLLSRDRKAFVAAYPFDVSPVDDNRPFFFYTVQPRDLWGFFLAGTQPSADYKINRAVPLLFGLVGISLLATGVMLALPPLVLGSRLPRERRIRVFLLYFVAIGVGYILIQVALIQKFVLFLGHPTYALTVIIFSMLVFSSLGSFFSRRLGTHEDRRLRMALVGVAALVALLAVGLAPLSTGGIGWPLPLRALLSVAAIAPAAFAMGMPFPSGLARLERIHKPSVRWAWSLNAASSVLGSALAIFLALYLGLRETLLAGGAFYLAACAALGRRAR